MKLKKLFFTLLLFVIVQQGTFAQFYVGPAIGLSRGNMRAVGSVAKEASSASDGYTYEGKFAPRYGITLMGKLHDYFYLGFGGYFNKYRFDVKDKTTSDRIENHLTYFYFPVNFIGNYEAMEDVLKIQAKVGPAIGIGMWGKEVYELNGKEQTDWVGYNQINFSEKEGTENQYLSRYNRFNFGANFGLQFQFYEHFLLSFDYSLGLSNLFPKYKNATGETADALDKARDDNEVRYSHFNITLSTLLFHKSDEK